MKTILNEENVVIEKYESIKELFLDRQYTENYVSLRKNNKTQYKVTIDDKVFLVKYIDGDAFITDFDKKYKIDLDLSMYEKYFDTEPISQDEKVMFSKCCNITLDTVFFNNLSYEQKEFYIVWNRHLTDDQVSAIKDDHNLVKLYFFDKRYISDSNLDKILKHTDVVKDFIERNVLKIDIVNDHSIKILQFMSDNNMLEKSIHCKEYEKLMESDDSYDAIKINNVEKLQDTSFSFLPFITGHYEIAKALYDKMENKEELFNSKDLYIKTDEFNFNEQLFDFIISKIDDSNIGRNTFYELCHKMFNNDIPQFLIPLSNLKLFRDEIDINFKNIVKHYSFDTIFKLKPELDADDFYNLIYHLNQEKQYERFYDLYDMMRDNDLFIKQFKSMVLKSIINISCFEQHRIPAINFNSLKDLQVYMEKIINSEEGTEICKTEKDKEMLKNLKTILS